MGRPRKFDQDAVVARAAEEFRANGYAETSPQDLVDSLGIGKGSLYNAFGSKHELFLLSLQRYAETSLADLRAAIESDGPVRERVRGMLTSFVEADLADPDRCGCLVVNTAVELGGKDDEVNAVLARSLTATESVLRAAFTAARAVGEIDADRDPRALAGLVQSAMIGLRVLTKTTDDRARLAMIIDATVAAI